MKTTDKRVVCIMTFYNTDHISESGRMICEWRKANSMEGSTGGLSVDNNPAFWQTVTNHEKPHPG
jgi:hypothetical protein